MPNEIGFIEAHGTGTQLGDPLELRALGAVFGPGRATERPLYVSSSKSNFGHLEGAAGIIGFVKLVLSLQHQEIAPKSALQQSEPPYPLGRASLRRSDPGNSVAGNRRHSCGRSQLLWI